MFRQTFNRAVLACCAAMGMAFAWVPAGCRAPGSTNVSGPTRFDRLMQLYPDLRSGRFIVLADFEDPKHMELFSLDDVSHHARFAFRADAGRAESGPAGLAFTVVSPDDALVIGNATATHWYLKRDWRDYDLLLMALHAPVRDLAAKLTIASGPPADRLVTQASVSLHKGWNLLRLDLASIGEHVSLDDVQEIRLAIAGAEEPVEVRLDDLLLTANRRDLFGDSSDPDAGLYVREVGRRWQIGAGGREAGFQITFSNGQVIEWYNTAADPYRLRNLLSGRPLGPTPIRLGSPTADRVDEGKVVAEKAGADQAGLFMPGPGVVARSRVLEMNAVRAVVSAEWRLVADRRSTKGGPDRRPSYQWVYTMYRTGQMYVRLTTGGETEVPLGSDLRLSVPVPAWSGDEPRTVIGTVDAQASTQPAPVYATARLAHSDALLLFVVHDPEGTARIVEPGGVVAASGDSPPRGSWIVHRSETGNAATPLAFHFLLGSAAAVSDEEALARAIDFASPAPPRLEIGEWSRIASAAPGNPGYDPGSGCYVIVPEDGQVRLVVDGSQRPAFSPAFRILDTQHRRAWVYVNHLLLNEVARDTNGNLIFQLPGIVRKRTVVEVLCRRPLPDSVLPTAR